jgi:hypothetical protein
MEVGTLSTDGLINAISSELQALGLPVQKGDDVDISIRSEFVNKSWGLGKKVITYEAAIWTDALSQSVHMWEKTTEATRGLSFGAESSSSFQSGKTLYRKVTGVQYGPDGKAHEYSLDLGAVSKAVRSAAEQNGFKFHTSLTRGKKR